MTAEVAHRLFTLPIAETILWFDGPVCWTTAPTQFVDERFLALFVDCDDEVDTYLFAALSERHAMQLAANQIGPRTAILASAGPIYSVVIRTDGTPDVASLHEAADLPEAWLPGPAAV